MSLVLHLPPQNLAWMVRFNVYLRFTVKTRLPFSLFSYLPQLRLAGSSSIEVVPELSAKEIKAAEKLARKAELSAKKEARLAAKKSGAADVDDESEATGKADVPDV